MSRWRVPHEQWVAWIEQGPDNALPRTTPLDSVDARLAERLAQTPFLIGDEETISRPELSGASQPFDSMTTMVRPAVEVPADDDATRLRPDPGSLEVRLQAPEDGLEVALDPIDEPPTIVAVPSAAVRQAAAAHADASRGAAARADVARAEVAHADAAHATASVAATGAQPPSPDVTAGHTVIASAPPPVSEPPAGQTVIAHAPPSPETEDDGLFIPTLTRTVVQPTPIPVEDSFAEAPSLGSPVAEPPPPHEVARVDPLPPAISGETVIGPPPAPPEDITPGSSTASGLIHSAPEPDEAAQTLTRGEVPGGPDEPVPPPSKVVVDPSASGMLEAIYDEDEDEPDEEPTVIEVEPQELDAEDLVEEEPGPEPRPRAAGPDESGPPPAPARPPAASRPTVEVGPPPPPVSASHIEAAMVALPSAPATDEGWQIDAFAEHFVALLPLQRPHVAKAEVDFILHCAGLTQGATVLDVGCGDGAHAAVMASRGLAVTGLDASPAQLMRASQSAQSMGLSINLVAGDMRQPPIDASFDAVVCLGGTLGLFGDEDDRLALQNMRDRLVPGGRLMLHVLNREYIAGRLPARSWWQGQGCLVLDEAQMFAATSRLHVHRTIVFETGTQFEHNIGLRVYGLTELIHMCAQVGLSVLEYSGSRHTRGRFYDATSSEIWLLAQRPLS